MEQIFQQACIKCDKMYLRQIVNSNNNYFKNNKAVRFNEAVRYGNLKTIKYLKEIGFFNIDSLTPVAFISTKDLKIIEWGLLNGINFNGDCFDYAIKCGFTIMMLKHLLENFDLSIGINSVSYAIERKDLNLLKFLKDKNARPSNMVKRYARSTHDDNIINWVNKIYV